MGALAILEMLQKLSGATPENFEALKTELDEVLEKSLPKTGKEKDKLKLDADKALEYATRSVKEALEKGMREEELKVEQAKEKEAEEEREQLTRMKTSLLRMVEVCMGVLDGLEIQVKDAESLADTLDGGSNLKPEDFTDKARSAKAAVHVACVELAGSQQNVQGIRKDAEELNLTEPLKPHFAKLTSRVGAYDQRLQKAWNIMHDAAKTFGTS